MDLEEYKKHAFQIVATKIGSCVQHACALAAGLAEPVYGFDLIHRILNSCIDEISIYEARLLMKQEGFTPINDEENKDGN